MTNEPQIIEEWKVIDRWWTPEPFEREYVDVEFWPGRRIVMVRELNGIWRIFKKANT